MNDNDPHLARYPSDHVAEETLLGSLMWDISGLWDGFGNRLKGELFHRENNRQLAEAIVDMHVAGELVDVLTLTDWLRKRGALEKLGGAARVTDLWANLNKPSHTIQVKRNLEILEGMVMRRTMLAQADAMSAAALDYTLEPKDALMKCEQALADMHHVRSHEGMVHISKVMPKAMLEIEQAIQRKGHVTSGVASGFTVLDKMTMGFGPGLHYVAARPSMGKTTLLLQWAMQVGCGFGDYPQFDQKAMGVMIFSCETHDVALVKRSLLNLAAINLQRARDGMMSRAQQEALKAEFQTGRRVGHAEHGRLPLIDSRIFVEASYGLTIQDFRARVRMLVKKHDIKIIFIDYLQLMKSMSKQAAGSREREIAEISWGLKMSALELGIPIVCLAQLNREGDVPRPKMSHLRESGSIEQDADSIMTICRAPDKLMETLQEDCPWTYMGVDILKQKDGPTTTDGDPIALRFDKEFFRLTSVDEQLYSNDPDEQQGNVKPKAEPQKWNGERPKGPRGRPRKDGSSLSSINPGEEQ